MAGGYVAGKRFTTDIEYNEAIEDDRIIREIRENTDFSNPEDVSKLYSLLQMGELKFNTILGREFDDEIYSLNEKFKQESIEAKIDKDKKADKKRLIKKSKEDTVSKTDKKKNINKTDKKISADIENAAQEIIRKKAVKNKIIGIAASVIAIGSLGYFIVYSKSAYTAQAAYDELASLKGTEPIVQEIEQKQIQFALADNLEAPEILDDYKNIYIKNKSIIGWLTIDNTNIDYPVMQTVNNEYYLDHDFEGKEDRNGALFMDASCNAAFRSTNLIIYGHHMKSGKMFGNLKKYESEDYCKQHNIIHFDTIYEKGDYEVMYVFRDNIRDEADISFKYYQFIDAVSAEEYSSNLNCMANMSLYDTGVTATYGDDLLTLSTCNGSTSTERFVVVAKRIK